jgi:hypothetical protein
LPSLQLYDWNLGYCFVVKSYSSSSRFGVIDSFFLVLCPWNLEEFKTFSVFQTFFGHHWNLVYCFVVQSYSSRLGVIDSFLQELCPLELRRMQEIFSFPDFFFAIFAAIWLLCSKELQFQFAFWSEWVIFAKVTPLELRRIFQFSILSMVIFAAVGLNLVYCFVLKS